MSKIRFSFLFGIVGLLMAPSVQAMYEDSLVFETYDNSSDSDNSESELENVAKLFRLHESIFEPLQSGDNYSNDRLYEPCDSKHSISIKNQSETERWNQALERLKKKSKLSSGYCIHSKYESFKKNTTVLYILNSKEEPIGVFRFSWDTQNEYNDILKKYQDTAELKDEVTFVAKLS